MPRAGLAPLTSLTPLTPLLLAFEFIPGFSQVVEPAPDQAIHDNRHGDHQNSGQQQDGEKAAIGCRADLRSPVSSSRRLEVMDSFAITFQTGRIIAEKLLSGK